MNDFDLHPQLVGENIHLRAINTDDKSDLFEVCKDPLLWEQHPDKNRYQIDAFQAWFNTALKSNALVIIDKQSQTIIGSSRYYEIEPENQSLAIGYTFLARRYWGGLTNKELKELMLNYAFQYFDKVWFHIAEDNLRSRKACEKIGANFSHKGQKNNSAYLWYELNKNDHHSHTSS